MVSMRAWLVAAFTLTQRCLAQTCRAELKVKNGGFECDIAPWYVPAPQPGQPVERIVSPGYRSHQALQLCVAASNFTDFSLINPDVGRQCEGYYYRVGFAVNWGTYSGPPSSEYIGCKVQIQSSYCYGDIDGAFMIYATAGKGWKHHSFTCKAMKTGEATFTVDFDCFGNATYNVPAFDFEVDALEIKLLGKSP